MANLKRFAKNLKQLLQQAIEAIEIRSPQTARLICSLIPNSCPFARTVEVFGRQLFSIPPLCHVNPLYEDLIALRYRALIFLDERST